MKNISWGSRIAILYTGFVLLIGTMVVLCIHQSIDLVSEDYYEQELSFQDKINKMKNTEELNEKVEHRFSADALELQFPSVFKDKELKGDILFFRPSDAAKDYKCQLSVNKDNVQKVGLDKLSKGMYKMQLSWSAGATSYFCEETIVIP